MEIMTRIFYEIFEIVFKFMICECYFEKKNWVNKINKKVILGVMVLFNTTITIYFKNSIINLVITTFMIFFICLLFFKGIVRKKIFLSTLLLIFSLLLEMTVSIPFKVISNYESNIKTNSDFLTFIISLTYLFLQFMIVKFINKNKKKSEVIYDNMNQIVLIIIPSISILFIVFFYYSELFSLSFDKLQFYFCIIMLLIINITHFVIHKNLQSLYKENYMNLTITKEYKYKEEYYKELEEHQNEIRMIKHDLKNQLLRIYGYDEVKSKQELEYLIEELIKKDNIFFTKNPGINSLLLFKYNEATKKDIKCFFNIKFPEKTNIMDYDLTNLLGNLLDNSIEACEKCLSNERIIILDLIYHLNSLVIHIENTTDRLVESLSSTKKERNEHGIGLQSIKFIVEKYEGEIEYNIEVDKFVTNINLWDIKKVEYKIK